MGLIMKKEHVCEIFFGFINYKMVVVRGINNLVLYLGLGVWFSLLEAVDRDLYFWMLKGVGLVSKDRYHSRMEKENIFMWKIIPNRKTENMLMWKHHSKVSKIFIELQRVLNILKISIRSVWCQSVLLALTHLYQPELQLFKYYSLKRIGIKIDYYHMCQTTPFEKLFLK